MEARTYGAGLGCRCPPAPESTWPFPNLLWPQRFNEKVLHRILFDRSDWLTQITDKNRARDFVRQRLGPEFCRGCFMSLMIRPSSLSTIFRISSLVKPTHGSGWVVMVFDKTTLDRAALITQCHSWLALNFYDINGEWAYKNAERRIFVEGSRRRQRHGAVGLQIIRL